MCGGGWGGCGGACGRGVCGVWGVGGLGFVCCGVVVLVGGVWVGVFVVLVLVGVGVVSGGFVWIFARLVLVSKFCALF
ncbi:hypothetical protein RA267_27490, partial [Pseudomonas syringae pv. tagetis]|uniref:hypothetical protein n=1 Tax=Pseudomonas syringae group genomosp. 7 TaxID=251699 RepID=UPI00376FAD14